MREKEELMLRLQDYEQKTRKAEKGGPRSAGISTHTLGRRTRLSYTQHQGCRLTEAGDTVLRLENSSVLDYHLC